MGGEVGARQAGGVRNQEAARSFDEEVIARAGEVSARGAGSSREMVTPARLAAAGGAAGRGKRIETDPFGRYGSTGGPVEAAGVDGVGVAAGLDGLERNEAATARARRAGGRTDGRLADAGVRTGDEETRAARLVGRSGCHASAPSRASSKAATSASVCSDEKVRRRRAVPSGTVGGRMAGAKMPRSARLERVRGRPGPGRRSSGQSGCPRRAWVVVGKGWGR